MIKVIIAGQRIPVLILYLLKVNVTMIFQFIKAASFYCKLLKLLSTNF